MPQQSKSIRILTGSLNLLTPGDKIPPEDAIQMENWRVDQDGALRTRPPVTKYYQLDNLLAPAIHTIAFDHNGNVVLGAGTKLYLNGSQIGDGFSGNPLGIVAMNGKTWIMDSTQPQVWDGTSLSNWGITAPASAPHAYFDISIDNSTGITGDYYWYVTFVYDDLSESNPSPASTLLSVGFPLVIGLREIAVSSDIKVTKRNIYRAGGTLGQPYLVATINDNTTTDWPPSALGSQGGSTGDNMSDATALFNGQALEFTHDGPPAADGLVGPYFGRLIAWKGNRMYWTQPGLPEYWPGADAVTGLEETVQQWVDVGDDSDSILAISLKARLALIYKGTQWWRLISDPDSGTLEIADSKKGILTRSSYASAGELDYVASFDGIYATADGVNSQKVSSKLDPLFQDRTDLIASGPVDRTPITDYPMEFANGRLHFSFKELIPADPPAVNSRTLVFDQASGRWATSRNIPPVGNVDGGGFSALKYRGAIYAAQDRTLVVIDQIPNLTFGAGYGPIPLAYQSRYEDCGLPESPKVFQELVIDYSNAGSSLDLAPEVGISVDNGIAPATIVGALSPSPRNIIHIPLGSGNGVEAKNLSVAIAAENPDGVVAIHSIYLHYYVEATPTVELQTIPFPIEPSLSLCEVKEMRVDADASLGPITITLSSDLPVQGINVRENLTYPQLAGRTPFGIPFVPIRGRIWKFAAQASSSVTPFRLYSVKLLARVLGDWVDGYEAGGFSAPTIRTWDSMPVNLGNDYLKVWDAVRFELETQGPADLVFSTDLPDESMVAKYSGRLAQEAMTRAWATMPFPQGIEGRLGQFVLSGTQGVGQVGFNVYKMQVRARVVGRYIAAQNGSNPADNFRTRLYEFGTERLKVFKKINLNMAVMGTVTVNVYTDGNSASPQATFNVSSVGTNQMFTLVLPFNTQGRLLGIEIISSAPCRLYGIRAWLRPLNEPNAGFSWAAYPLDGSAVIDGWIDLPVPELPGNSDTWQWIAIPGIGIPEGE